MNQSLKNIVRSPAWKEVEKIFLEEIANLDRCSGIDGTMSNTVVSREVRARAIAAKSLRAVLSRIKLGAHQLTGETPKKLI
jgi:hypothetical protein